LVCASAFYRSHVWHLRLCLVAVSTTSGVSIFGVGLYTFSTPVVRLQGDSLRMMLVKASRSHRATEVLNVCQQVPSGNVSIIADVKESS
jgi:hypothetical protein